MDKDQAPNARLPAQLTVNLGLDLVTIPLEPSGILKVEGQWKLLQFRFGGKEASLLSATAENQGQQEEEERKAIPSETIFKHNEKGVLFNQRQPRRWQPQKTSRNPNKVWIAKAPTATIGSAT